MKITNPFIKKDEHVFKLRTVKEVVHRLDFLYDLIDKLEKEILTTKGEVAEKRRFLENTRYALGSLEWLLYMRDDNGKWIGEIEENEEE